MPSSSFISRIYNDFGNALSDAYGHVVHGDDAGKSVKIVFVARPRQIKVPKSGDSLQQFDLGLTFIEVNSRAYVRTVDPCSEAARAGIQPRDAVQFVAVLGGSELDDIMSHVSGRPEHRNENYGASFALECEHRGMRTSYDELQQIFEECIISKNQKNSRHGSSSKNSNGRGDALSRHRSGADDEGENHRHDVFETKRPDHRKSSTISVRNSFKYGSRAAISTTCGSDAATAKIIERLPSSPMSPDGDAIYPVAIVFRRTRKRQSIGGSSHIGLPSFRLDDECDRAACLIRRLAPTADTEPEPDAWDEIVHDTTEWLLPTGSMFPPEDGFDNGLTGADHLPLRDGRIIDPQSNINSHNTSSQQSPSKDGAEETIPLDELEVESTQKLSRVRSQMQAEALRRREAQPGSSRVPNGSDDVEASTIRGMIQKAVGLAFVRASKVVLGVSMHGGSGIVIARLPDGTWSAPSAVGLWGLGLGVQFGLEVAEYIFILQTEDCMEHFRRGGNFTIGGNIGAAFAGMGREAYGAASVGGLCNSSSSTLPQGGASSVGGSGFGLVSEYDENVDDFGQSESPSPFQIDGSSKRSEIAPIVAYAKSQGLYFGVSLEGSRIFTRNDINTRTYKFTTGREVNTADILGGMVATPPEAEDLYASLHSVEFTHEISGLPRPPEILRQDSQNDWRYDRSTLSAANTSAGTAPPFSFLSNITDEESEECSTFETKFKKFLYGGVSVQRLVPDAEPSGGKTRRERRTLWLMLPEVGALRLGFISKLGDGEGSDSKKRTFHRLKGRSEADEFSQHSVGSISGAISGASEDGTADDTTAESNKMTKNGAVRHIQPGRVHLSSKHAVALTDVTILSQEPNVSIRYNPDDATEHLRVISIQDVSGKSLLFLANNFREAELLVCGLKLLLERETARLGVRGGVPITQLGGDAVMGAMSPAAARGLLANPHHRKNTDALNHNRRALGTAGGYSSSENEEGGLFTEEKIVPEGRKSWSQVPARNYLRGVASQSRSSEDENTFGYNDSPHVITNHESPPIPKYVHGQLLIQDISTNVSLPLPLPLCRVLLLDSSSPVISKWEADRGDTNYSKSQWTFPPATPRELEHHDSEHQLIATGSMIGAHRTTSYDRVRNGEVVHLSETQIVDADDPEKLAFTVSERMPRRGFSVKVRILLRAAQPNTCEATILGEVRPMGKNMSNQLAVHKAFLLVISEINSRYGTDGKGLLAGFLNVVNNMPAPGHPFPRTHPNQNGPSQVEQRRHEEFQWMASFGARGNPHRTQEDDKQHWRGRDQPEQTQPPERPSRSYDRQHYATISRADRVIPNEKQNKSEPKQTTGRTSEASTPDKFSSMEKMHTSRKSSSKRENSLKKLETNRPPTPSMDRINDADSGKKQRKTLPSNDFEELPGVNSKGEEKVLTVEVKPLPKIRLSLMPSPREEDEEHENKSSRRKKSKRSGSGKRRSRHSESG